MIVSISHCDQRVTEHFVPGILSLLVFVIIIIIIITGIVIKQELV